MPRNLLPHLLGLLLFGLGPALAQQLPAAPARYETFNGFGPAERATMNDQQAAAFLEVVNTLTCPCGCAKGTIAECRHVDPGCGVSRGMAIRLMELVKAEPGLDAAGLKSRLQTEMAAQQAARAKAMEEARKAEEERARAIHQVPVGDSAWEGAEHAKVTIVVFSEFQCPFCARVAPTLKKVLETYPADVKIVFKHYIVHETAIPASEAAIEAHAQGKFWQMHDRLFQNMRAHTRPNLELWAQELGLDMERFKAALDGGKHRAHMELDQRLGQQLGVNSTPTLFVNGRMLLGAQPLEVFQERVEQERARAQKLLDAGVAPEKLYDELTKPQPADGAGTATGSASGAAGP